MDHLDNEPDRINTLHIDRMNKAFRMRPVQATRRTFSSVKYQVHQSLSQAGEFTSLAARTNQLESCVTEKILPPAASSLHVGLRPHFSKSTASAHLLALSV
jgi:hypothetical protein